MKNVLLIGGCGYIGSYLSGVLSGEDGYAVESVDLEWFGNPARDQNACRDFCSLPREYIRSFDVVVLTAAHSSVPLCEGDRYGAFKNNVDNFIGLASKMNRHQKLIYASSSCVYVDSQGRAADEGDLLRPVDILSYTKTAIDQFAPLTGVEYYGLRFGSVAGWAPNLRADLMVNAMTLAALQGNSLTACNRHCHRPILGTGDLGRAVRAVIDCDRDQRGIYNVASFNATIGEVATAVGRHLMAEVNEGPDSRTYDFCIDTAKFQRAFGFEFDDTLASIVDGIVTRRGTLKTQNRSRNTLYVASPE